MDFWKRAAGKFRRSIISSEIIRQEMEIQHDIINDVITKKII